MLLDLMLPGKSGLQVLQEIRAVKPRLPVIARGLPAAVRRDRRPPREGRGPHGEAAGSRPQRPPLPPGPVRLDQARRHPVLPAGAPVLVSSSAARPESPEFTIKALGNFTETVGRLDLGTLIHVDGPHGSFSPTHPDGDYLLIAGGVGITPMMSILRSFADTGERRRVCLVYASREWDDVTFREELDDLKGRLLLTVHHVLSRPHSAWPGHRGRLSEAVLRQCLQRLRAPFNVFVCGSPKMVEDAAGRLQKVGIPDAWVHTEKFAGA